MAYTLQPAVIVAFMVLMMGVFDQIIYKDCVGMVAEQESGTPTGNFIKINSFTQSNLSNTKPYWVFNDDLSDGCKKSFGYKLAAAAPGKYMKKGGLLSGNVMGSGAAGEVGKQAGETAVQLFSVFKFATTGSDFPEMLKALMICAFFAFLFYHFAQQLAKFAADVSQSTNLGDQAIGATAVMDTAKTAAEAVADAKTGGGYSKAKEAASAAGVGGGGVNVSSSAGKTRKGISVSSKKK